VAVFVFRGVSRLLAGERTDAWSKSTVNLLAADWIWQTPDPDGPTDLEIYEANREQRDWLLSAVYLDEPPELPIWTRTAFLCVLPDIRAHDARMRAAAARIVYRQN
jgi:hypothetical protein